MFPPGMDALPTARREVLPRAVGAERGRTPIPTVEDERVLRVPPRTTDLNLVGAGDLLAVHRASAKKTSSANNKPAIGQTDAV